jgi:succinyl-CoA synthetase beta subunit
MRGNAMQITGMLYGARLLHHVDFPATEVLGPGASESDIQALIDRHKLIFVKPLFKGGVGKKGKAGLVGTATDLRTALREKERLYFAEHRHGNVTVKANGVTFEAGVPADHEVYFAISDATQFRAPTMTLTHKGGIDIEDVDRSVVASVPFDALTGLKAFVVANALSDIGAPREIVSPLVQHLPKAVGADAPLRHDDARAEPDPDAGRRRWPTHARGVRLQVQLRPGRSALAAARPA